MSKQEQDKLGIFQNHAYSLLNIYSGMQTDNGEVTLLRVRNPWGRKEWQGSWSFSSPLWTKQLRQKLDYE
jgi:calpain-15